MRECWPERRWAYVNLFAVCNVLHSLHIRSQTSGDTGTYVTVPDACEFDNASVMEDACDEEGDIACCVGVLAAMHREQSFMKMTFECQRQEVAMTLGKAPITQKDINSRQNRGTQGIRQMVAAGHPLTNCVVMHALFFEDIEMSWFLLSLGVQVNKCVHYGESMAVFAGGRALEPDWRSNLNEKDLYEKLNKVSLWETDYGQRQMSLFEAQFAEGSPTFGAENLLETASCECGDNNWVLVKLMLLCGGEGDPIGKAGYCYEGGEPIIRPNDQWLPWLVPLMHGAKQTTPKQRREWWLSDAGEHARWMARGGDLLCLLKGLSKLPSRDMPAEKPPKIAKILGVLALAARLPLSTLRLVVEFARPSLPEAITDLFAAHVCKGKWDEPAFATLVSANYATDALWY
jgi:hypothetical protein